MNSKTARRIRQALRYRPSCQTAEYEPPQVHHLAEMPKYEMVTRIKRSYDPGLACIVGLPVEKIRYAQDGRTPAKPILISERLKNEASGKAFTVSRQATELIPIAKPRRLKAGSPRAVYKLMKRLERRIGLDNVYAQLAAEAAA